MVSLLVQRVRLGGSPRNQLSRAMVVVSAAGTLAAGAGLLLSGRLDGQPNVRMFGMLALAIAGWCLWQMWTDRLHPIAVMGVVTASIGVMGVFTDHTFQVAISTILVLYAGVGAVLIRDTRRFWAFTVYVGVAGSFHLLAHQLGIGLAHDNDALLSHMIIQGIVFWTAAWVFRKVRDEIVTREQVHHAKDKFLARVGHELRTPLTAVLAYAEMILEDETTPDPTRERVAVIADEAREMSATIEDFTVVSRVTNQLLTLSPKTFLLIPEINKTLSTVRSNDITPQVTGPPDTLVHTDTDRLRQILRILVANALQHAHAFVEVSVGGDRDGTWIDVIDDGPGLPETVKAFLEASWHPHTERGQPEHLGRGLLVAHELAHVMDVDLTYSRQGGKTAFRVLIPVESTHPSSADDSGKPAESRVSGMTTISMSPPRTRRR